MYIVKGRSVTVARYRDEIQTPFFPRRRSDIISNVDIPNSAPPHEYLHPGSDVVQSGRPIFDDFFQRLWPYIGNNTANVVFQMVKRLWLIRIDQ
ncbi:hypothetical protein TNCV_843781 [Trichonephila clavipes]|nr:hypothetical protein TNCV_843781 [Trichonephila clavipes]